MKLIFGCGPHERISIHPTYSHTRRSGSGWVSPARVEPINLCAIFPLSDINEGGLRIHYKMVFSQLVNTRNCFKSVTYL